MTTIAVIRSNLSQLANVYLQPSERIHCLQIFPFHENIQIHESHDQTQHSTRLNVMIQRSLQKIVNYSSLTFQNWPFQQIQLRAVYYMLKKSHMNKSVINIM